MFIQDPCFGLEAILARAEDGKSSKIVSGKNGAVDQGISSVQLEEKQVQR